MTSVLSGPSRASGMATAETALSEVLSSRADMFNVTVLYVSDEKSLYHGESIEEWIEEYARRNIRVVALSKQTDNEIIYKPSAKVKHLVTSYETYRYLDHHQHEFDLISFHEFRGVGYYSVNAKAQGLSFHKCVIVHTIHCPSAFWSEGMREPLKNMKQMVNDFTEQRSVERSDVVVSPSAFLLGWVQRRHWRLPEKTFVQQNILSRETSRLIDSAQSMQQQTQGILMEIGIRDGDGDQAMPKMGIGGMEMGIRRCRRWGSGGVEIRGSGDAEDGDRGGGDGDQGMEMGMGMAISMTLAMFF